MRYCDARGWNTCICDFGRLFDLLVMTWVGIDLSANANMLTFVQALQEIWFAT